MASNPMQRQKRTSFLLGFLTMLILSVIVIGFLGFTLFQMKAEEKAEQEAMKDAYVLTSDVKSGESINASVMKKQKVSGDLVPNNRFVDANFVDEEGNEIEDLVAKIDLNRGTIVTADMVTISSEKATDDIRIQEYNIATLPTEIQTGDYVDIRIRFPSGLDYIIVSKKQINILQAGGVDSVDTFTVNLSEDETLLMSCAIVEAFAVNGTEIYVNIYRDPGMQAAATPTYQLNDQVQRLVSNNPNITDEAKAALFNRYSSEERGKINAHIESAEDALDNIEAGIESHITRQKQYKQEYLDALSGM